jgi:WD40 repeat protein
LASWEPPGRVYNLAFHPDADWLAWSGAGAVGLVHWPSGRKGPDLPAHKGNVLALAFNHDGKLLASAGEEDRIVRIQQLAPDEGGGLSLVGVRRISAPRMLCELTFSPAPGRLGGSRLAGISRDIVKVWDPESKLELLTLRGAPQRYWDGQFTPRVAFSPDGGGLVGTNWDESISLWEAERAGEVESPELQRENVRLADARAAFWHIQEAEQCLQHLNRPAARFHLQWVGEVPLPQPLRLRKERLERGIGEGQPGR